MRRGVAWAGLRFPQVDADQCGPELTRCHRGKQTPEDEMAETFEVLKFGQIRVHGTLHGWTGNDCPKCKGTGEDFSDENAPRTSCGWCGGTGDEHGPIPETKLIP